MVAGGTSGKPGGACPARVWAGSLGRLWIGRGVAEAAASKNLTDEKTGDRCYSRRNPDGLSTFRAPWIPALMQESTPVFSSARS